MKLFAALCAMVVAFAASTANASFVTQGSVAVGNNTFVYAVSDLGGGMFQHYFQLNNPTPPKIASGTSSFGVLTPSPISSLGLLSGQIIDLGSSSLVTGGTNNRGTVTQTPTQVSLDIPHGSLSTASQILTFKSSSNTTFTGFVVEDGSQQNFVVQVPVPAALGLVLAGAPFVGLIRRRLKRA